METAGVVVHRGGAGGGICLLLAEGLVPRYVI